MVMESAKSSPVGVTTMTINLKLGAISPETGMENVSSLVGCG